MRQPVCQRNAAPGNETLSTAEQVVLRAKAVGPTDKGRAQAGGQAGAGHTEPVVCVSADGRGADVRCRARGGPRRAPGPPAGRQLAAMPPTQALAPRTPVHEPHPRGKCRALAALFLPGSLGRAGHQGVFRRSEGKV